MSVLGDEARIALRRRWVLDNRAHKSMSLDDLTDAWNAKCIAEDRPEDCRKRSTIATDLKEGLKLLNEETKLDASLYRDMIAARIEFALSRPKFVKAIENGDFGAVDRLLKATSQLSLLYGANAPTKVAQTDVNGNDVAVLTDEDRKRRIEELVARAAARAEDTEAEESHNP